jgi:glycerol uptake facilitator-like aquaporin
MKGSVDMGDMLRIMNPKVVRIGTATLFVLAAVLLFLTMSDEPDARQDMYKGVGSTALVLAVVGFVVSIRMPAATAPQPAQKLTAELSHPTAPV